MHMGISQEQFFAKKYRRNAGDQSYDDGVKHISHLLTNQNHHETSGSGFVHPTFVSSMINSWSKLPITSPARVTEEHDPKESWEISRDTYIIIRIYMLYIYMYAYAQVDCLDSMYVFFNSIPEKLFGRFPKKRCNIDPCTTVGKSPFREGLQRLGRIYK